MQQHNSFRTTCWLPCPTGSRAFPFPQRQILQGRYCRLEPLTAAHASALFAAHHRWPRIPEAGRGYCANLTTA